MRLYIVRHADPDYANNTITPAGHLEAKALAKWFKTEGLDKIYSSPLGRAIDTMQYTADLLGLEPNIEHWTEELDNTVQHPTLGKIHMVDVPGEVIRGQQPYHTHETWHSTEPYTQKELEKYEFLREYSDEFIGRHGYKRQGGRYQCVTPNKDKVAVFCHGGFGLTWLAMLLEIPPTLIWSGFWLPPSSVTTILFDERSKEWAVPRCIGFGSVPHLYEAGLPILPRGIKANFE